MNINNLLKQKNITKYRLSKNSGVPHTTINDICNNRVSIEKCSAETLYKLSKALDVPMESLVLDFNKALVNGVYLFLELRNLPRIIGKFAVAL